MKLGYIKNYTHMKLAYIKNYTHVVSRTDYIPYEAKMKELGCVNIIEGRLKRIPANISTLVIPHVYHLDYRKWSFQFSKLDPSLMEDSIPFIPNEKAESFGLIQLIWPFNPNDNSNYRVVNYGEILKHNLYDIPFFTIIKTLISLKQRNIKVMVLEHENHLKLFQDFVDEIYDDFINTNTFKITVPTSLSKGHEWINESDTIYKIKSIFDLGADMKEIFQNILYSLVYSKVYFKMDESHEDPDDTINIFNQIVALSFSNFKESSLDLNEDASFCTVEYTLVPGLYDYSNRSK